MGAPGDIGNIEWIQRNISRGFIYYEEAKFSVEPDLGDDLIGFHKNTNVIKKDR